MEQSHGDSNHDRILRCSTTSVSVGCSRPTLCIVLLRERNNEELRCRLHCIGIIYSLDKYPFVFINIHSLCLLQSVSSFHLIRHANKCTSRRTLFRVESTVYSKKESVHGSTSRLRVSSEHSDSRRMATKQEYMQSTSKLIHDDAR